MHQCTMLAFLFLLHSVLNVIISQWQLQNILIIPKCSASDSIWKSWLVTIARWYGPITFFLLYVQKICIYLDSFNLNIVTKKRTYFILNATHNDMIVPFDPKQAGKLSWVRLLYFTLTAKGWFSLQQSDYGPPIYLCFYNLSKQS